jgi:hypothetical protein
MMNCCWSIQRYRLPAAAAVLISAADSAGCLLCYQQLHHRYSDLAGSRYDLITSLCQHGDEPLDLLKAGDFLVVGVNVNASMTTVRH